MGAFGNGVVHLRVGQGLKQHGVHPLHQLGRHARRADDGDPAGQVDAGHLGSGLGIDTICANRWPALMCRTSGWARACQRRHVGGRLRGVFQAAYDGFANTVRANKVKFE